MQNSTTILDLTASINDLSGGGLVLLLLFAIFLIIMVAFRNTTDNIGFQGLLFFASLVTSFFGLMFWAADLIILQWVLIPISLTVVGLIWMFATN